MPNIALPDGNFLEVPSNPTPEYAARVRDALASAFPEEYGERSYLGYIPEIAKAVPRGLAGTYLTALEGLGSFANAATDAVGLESLIDAGEENAVIAHAREGREALNESFLGASAPYRDQWAVKAGEALGSFASFAIPGTAVMKLTSLQGAKAMLPILPLASMAGAGEASQRVEAARASGLNVTQEQENASVMWGSLIGATELAPVHNILKRINKLAAPKFKKEWMHRIHQAVISGGLEGAQEVAASLMQDAVEKGYYNPDLDFGESWWEEFTLGGFAGFAGDLALRAMGGRRFSITDQGWLDKETDSRKRRAEGLERQRAVLEQAEKDLTFPALPAPDPELTPDQIMIEGDEDPVAFANRLSITLGDRFPLNTTWSVVPVSEGLVSVQDGDGVAYGQPMTLEEGTTVAGELNNQQFTDAINREVNNKIALTGDYPSGRQRRLVEEAGQRILDPEQFTFPSFAIDFYGGTTSLDEGYNESLTWQEIEAEAQQRPWRKLTKTQEMNKARAAEGKSPLNNFSVEQAKQALTGEQFRAMVDGKVEALTNAGMIYTQEYVDDLVVLAKERTAKGKLSSKKESRQARQELKALEDALLVEAVEDPAEAGMPDKLRFGRYNLIADEAEARSLKRMARVVDKKFTTRGVRPPPGMGENVHQTRAALETIAQQKNISFDPDSPAWKFFFKQVTGKEKLGPVRRAHRKADEMSPDETALVWLEMMQLPSFPTLTTLPDFSPSSLNANQYDAAKTAVIASGRVSNDLLKEAMSIEGRKVRSATISEARRLLAAEGVIPTPQSRSVTQTTEPSPEEDVVIVDEPVTLAQDIDLQVKVTRNAVDKTLRGRGVNNINTRILNTVDDATGRARDLETGREVIGVGRASLGTYSAALHRVTVVLRELDPSVTEEMLAQDVAGRVNHELIHAMRELDLFTEGEWKALTKYAESAIEPISGLTFLERAQLPADQDGYADQPITIQIEESVAELYRNHAQGLLEKAVTGKPRSLLDRITHFFSRMVEVVRGTPEALTVLEAITSGEIGGRPAEIRTLRETEAEIRALEETPTTAVPGARAADAPPEAIVGERVSDLPPPSDREMRAYHGSRTPTSLWRRLGGRPPFDEFKVPTQPGRIQQGWGMYFTDETSSAQAWGPNVIPANIPSPERMLHWNESFSNQPEGVRVALDQLGLPISAENTGQEIYDLLADQFMPPVPARVGYGREWMEQDLQANRMASEKLSEVGVDGTYSDFQIAVFDPVNIEALTRREAAQPEITDVGERVPDLPPELEMRAAAPTEEEVQIIPTPDGGVDVLAFHGKFDPGLPESKTRFGGLHIGTKKAAEGRMEYFRPDPMKAERWNVIPVKAHLRQPFGTAARPVTEHDLAMILNLPDMETGGIWHANDEGWQGVQSVAEEGSPLLPGRSRGLNKLKEEGYDGIIYRNIVEDEGSLSVLILDTTVAAQREEIPDREMRQSLDRTIGSLEEIDGGRYFNPKALFHDIHVTSRPKSAHKSKEILISLSPKEFLSLVPGVAGRTTEEKTEGLRELVEGGDQFRQLLHLSFQHDGRTAKVYGHEGRHRAMALESLGVEQMPVILKSLGYPGGRYGQGEIEWTEQYSDDADSYGRLEVWPETLEAQGEYATNQIPFPVADPLAVPQEREMRAQPVEDAPPLPEGEVRAPTPEQLEEAVATVDQQAEEAVANGTVPRFSTKASPEAKYVALNPDEGMKLPQDMSERFMLSNVPVLPDRIQKIMNRRLPYEPEGQRETFGQRVLGTLNAESGSELATRLREDFVYRYARWEPIGREMAAKDARTLWADSSAIAAMNMADLSGGYIASAWKWGQIAYKDGGYMVEDVAMENGEMTGGLLDILEPIYKDQNKSRLWQLYMIERRARYSNSQGKLLDIPDSELKSEWDDVSAEVEANYPELIEVAEKYDAWNNQLIQFMTDTGLVNKETAQEWIDSSFYYPFYRQMEGEEAGRDRVFKTRLMTGANSLVRQKLEGSRREFITDPIEAIGKNLSAAITAGMKNVAGQRAMRDAVALGYGEEVKQKKDGNYTILIDGKERHYAIGDLQLVASLMSMSQGELTPIINVLAKPASLLRSLVTKSPDFMAAAIFRDVGSAAVTSGASLPKLAGAVKNAFGPLENMERRGFGLGYDFQNDPRQVKEWYKQEYRKRGVGGHGLMPMDAFRRVWDALGQASTRSDVAIRKSVYEDVLARTGNEAEAIYQGWEVINFSRRGASPTFRVLTASIPFLNARIQGLDVFYRAGRGRYSSDPRKNKEMVQRTFIYRSLLMAGLTGLYYLLVSDSEDYREASPIERDMNYIIPVLGGLKLPVPFEVGFLFKTIPEKILDTIYGTSTQRDLAGTILRGAGSTFEFNPLGIQAIAPLVEYYYNKSFFTGREIVPYYMLGQESFMQKQWDSTILAQNLGKALNISPLKIDHLMRGYTGTLGTYAIDLADAVARQFAGPEYQVPKRLQDFPVVRRFYQGVGSGYQQAFYDLDSDVQRMVQTFNKLQKDGRMDEAYAYYLTRPELLESKEMVNAISRFMDSYRERRDAIRNSKIPDDTKRDFLDQLDEEKNRLLKEIPQMRKDIGSPFLRLGNTVGL